MPIDFKSSETKENLMRAFAGESQARNRYTFAAELAGKQQIKMVQLLFTFTANQEKQHAYIFYNHLKDLAGENIEISSAAYPVEISNDLGELLSYAKHDEYEEANNIYTTFGQKAKEEGFDKVAYAFNEIAKIEKIHGDRFSLMADLIKSNQYFVSSVQSGYMCLNCGYIYEGTKVPGVCPVCQADKGYFIYLDLLKKNEFLTGI